MTPTPDFEPHSYLSDHLGSADLVGVKYVLVTFDLFANNARTEQSAKYVSVYTPKPIENLLWDSSAYTMAIANGHPLNPDGVRNRINVKQVDRSRQPQWTTVSFQMTLDGTQMQAADGQHYVVAVGGNGEGIPASVKLTTEIRPDLAIGDPPADRSTVQVDLIRHYDSFATQFHWIGSLVRNIDVSLHDVPVMRSRPGARRSHFN